MASKSSFNRAAAPVDFSVEPVASGAAWGLGFMWFGGEMQNQCHRAILMVKLFQRSYFSYRVYSMSTLSLPCKDSEIGAGI